MRVIATPYVSHSRALCESKKALGDRIRKLKESLGYKGRRDGLSTKSDQRVVKQDVMTMQYLALFGNRIESAGCQTRLAPGLPHGSLTTVANHPVPK